MGMTSSDIRQLFRQRFNEDPTVVGVAPGRINLIGEHTDYNDGFVFPAAIDKGMKIAASVTNGPTELFSVQVGEGEPFDVESIYPGQVKGWTQYPAGMAWVMKQQGELPNIRAVIDSDVPLSGGVSSSAAIEMAFGIVWNEVAELYIPNMDLALLAQKCENKFVGVNSGIMDQMASAMGKDGHAMFLDTRSLDIEYAPVPAGLVAVLCDTAKPRALTDSAYNERRSQCEEACAFLSVPKLRDADMDMLERAKCQLRHEVYLRARHVISENDRCVQFVTALSSGDLQLVGELMRYSHESLRDDYEVSCVELDAMAESAWASPGCIGARMMGAGFGGSCIALVEASKVGAFGESLLESYLAKTGIEGAVMPTTIVEGAHLFD